MGWPTYSGAIATGCVALAEMAAKSPTLRVRAGLAADKTAAAALDDTVVQNKLIFNTDYRKRTIFIPAYEIREEFVKGRLTVGIASASVGMSQSAGGARNYLNDEGGELVLTVTDIDTTHADLTTSYFDTATFMGDLLKDISDLAGATGPTTGYLRVTDIETISPPGLPDAKDVDSIRGYWWLASFLVRWR